MTDKQVDRLGNWIDAQRAFRAVEAAPPAEQRGRAIFERADVGCVTCHAGARLTGPGSHDVGTGGVFQVPTLEGLRYRAPYMHDGCADSLDARFRYPACGGGDRHGVTSHLSESELADLTAYLMSR
ncbi:MAG: c-type cytochrome [Myxococcales bacterium]|nr:c-type cytochrome [Myxococcales bacterium]